MTRHAASRPCRPSSPFARTTSMNAAAWPISSWLSSLCGGGAPCGSLIGADRRTRRDFAEPLRLLADEDRPQARRIVLVADNLNTWAGRAL